MKNAIADEMALLAELLKRAPLSQWAGELKQICLQRLSPDNHSNLIQWRQAIKDLDFLTPRPFHVKHGKVTIGDADSVESSLQTNIEGSLRQLLPWRKGPYSIYGLTIDTEWRSDLKWERFIDHIKPLQDRAILDVGCGNGYFCWRMAEQGARLVIGIDPFLLNIMQFRMIRSLAATVPIFLAPIGIEETPDDKRFFDTVFSMGVLYHRRSPLDHLYKLKGLLRTGGELVLETLVIDGKEGDVLLPEDRYGKMRNVWFIPSPALLLKWLRRCGFKNGRLIDITPTTTREQRPTDWMTFESLPDFLNKNDPSKTVEGHPAPVRAVFLADAP